MTRDRRTARAATRIQKATAALELVPFGTAATPAERGFSECPCQKDCALHGSCHLCVAYHASKGQVPRCTGGVQ